MITKNFKNLSRLLLIGDGPDSETGSVRPGLLRVVATDGGLYYLRHNATENSGDFAQYTNDAVGQGITFGSGTTLPTENDYKLEAPITSGISVTRDVYKTTVTSEKISSEIHFSVTNVSGSQITISEIGLKKVVPVALVPNNTGTTVNGSNDAAINANILLDRTVLNEPVTISVSDTVELKYILSVDHPSKTKTVNGVKCVPFETGTDAEIADMIDAAQNGLIDLQSDGGWQIGDKRQISVSSFTFVGSSVAAYSPFIEITSFDDYNNCGCVMQFDFYECFNQRVNLIGSADSVVTSYADLNSGFSAFADALPAWLKSRLITFSVLSCNASGSIETVSGNKLALRSLKEIYGSDIRSDVRSGVENEGSGIAGFVNDKSTKKTNRLRRYADGGTSWSSAYDSGYVIPATRSIKNFNDKTIYTAGYGEYYRYAPNPNADNCGWIAPFGCL